jgi:hypothetical protein
LRAEETLKTMAEHPRLEIFQKRVKANYERLKKTLAEWELHALEYRDAVCESRQKKMFESRLRFKQSLRQWDVLITSLLRFAK